jgi:hypothetical protein
MMRTVVKSLADLGVLPMLKPDHAAQTYGISTAEVEAEIMKHMTEGSEGK